MDIHLIAVRLAIALALGCAIGFERQWNQKVAGLRTNSLVALGAAGFVLMSELLSPNGDTTRVAAQVVSGIGFLGAGVIIREGVNVHGLTTAATLWCSAMVGTLTGAGFLAPAALAAVFVVGTNIVLRPVVRLLAERAVNSTDVETAYSLTVTCKIDAVKRLRLLLLDTLTITGLAIRQIKSETIAGTELARIVVRAVASQKMDVNLEKVTGTFIEEVDVTAASWRSARANPDV